MVIEDGSVVSGAVSYVSRADYIAYAATLGVTIEDDGEADIELIRAAQFIGSHEDNLKGVRVSRDQSMAFPRGGVMIDGFEWSDSEIPRNVVLCQMAVALEIHEGIDPYNPPVNPARATRREKVEGAVEVEYFGSDNAVKLSRASTATALLNSLLMRSGLMSIELIRA